MSTIIQERYSPVAMAAASTYTFPSGAPTQISGFLCATSGTITVTSRNGNILINAFPMTSGVYYPMPFYVGAGAVVQLGTGASGTLGTG